MVSVSLMALVAAGVACSGITYLCVKAFKTQKMTILALQKELAQMSQDFRVQTSSALNMGERLKRLERRTFGHASTSAQKSSTKDEDHADNAYTEAAKILENGGTVQDIISKCNISATEAELIESLFQQMQDADVIS